MTAEGLPLHVETRGRPAGAGETFILLHGYGASSFSWRSSAIWNRRPPIPNGTWHALRHEFPAQVDQAAVFDAGGTGALAGPACQASVEMALGGLRCRCALYELLDEIDATTRAVEFGSGDAISGAGRKAEAAVNAVPQQSLCLGAAGGPLKSGGWLRKHLPTARRTSDPDSEPLPDRTHA